MTDIVKALEKMAGQKKSDELDEPEHADYESGYDIMVDMSRKALEQARKDEARIKELEEALFNLLNARAEAKLILSQKRSEHDG